MYWNDFLRYGHNIHQKHPNITENVKRNATVTLTYKRRQEERTNLPTAN